MSSQVGSGHVAVFPVLTGFKSTISKEIKASAADGAKAFGSGFRGVGTSVGKRLGSDVKTAMAAAAGDLGAKQLSNLNRDVASASAALSRARLKQQDEAGRVRVAEVRLQEAIAKGGEGSARAVAAEERLASARRTQQAATDAVTAASTRLAAAQSAVAAATAQTAAASSQGTSRLLGLSRSFAAGFRDAAAARSSFTGLSGSIGGLLRSVSDVSGLTKLGGLARAAAQQASTAFTSLATMVGGRLAGAGRTAVSALSSIGSTVGRALAPVGRSIASVAATVASPFVQLGSKVSTWLSPVTTQVSGLFAKVGAAAGPAVGRIASSFQSGLSGLASTASSALSSLVGVVGGAASRVGAALGNGIKAGATAGVAAVAAGIGIAFTKGVGRLQAIDVAQAKLRGLGNDAGTVQAIMGDALASVKGTAFGLGEAATVAAAAVAAGIKPGTQLQGTLKGIANVAAATNGTMEETGAVFNKVAATGRAYAENINQLADRGLPIWQALGKQLGVTTDEVRDLAAKGEIDFATFSAAASAAAGTVALEMGTTVPGAAKNFFAAMGRIGANALGGLYSKVGPLIQAATAALGPIEERAKQFGDILTRVVGPAMDWVTGLLNKIGSGASLAGTGLGGLTGLLGPLAAGLGAVGIGGLGGLLTRIPLLSTLLPGLSGALGLLGGPLGIAGAALAGFLASGGDAGALVTSITGVIDQVVGMLPTLIDAVVGAVPGSCRASSPRYRSC